MEINFTDKFILFLQSSLKLKLFCCLSASIRTCASQAINTKCRFIWNLDYSLAAGRKHYSPNVKIYILVELNENKRRKKHCWTIRGLRAMKEGATTLSLEWTQISFTTTGHKELWWRYTNEYQSFTWMKKSSLNAKLINHWKRMKNCETEVNKKLCWANERSKL